MKIYYVSWTDDETVKREPVKQNTLHFGVLPLTKQIGIKGTRHNYSSCLCKTVEDFYKLGSNLHVDSEMSHLSERFHLETHYLIYDGWLHITLINFGAVYVEKFWNFPTRNEGIFRLSGLRSLANIRESTRGKVYFISHVSNLPRLNPYYVLWNESIDNNNYRGLLKTCQICF